MRPRLMDFSMGTAEVIGCLLGRIAGLASCCAHHKTLPRLLVIRMPFVFQCMLAALSYS